MSGKFVFLLGRMKKNGDLMFLFSAPFLPVVTTFQPNIHSYTQNIYSHIYINRFLHIHLYGQILFYTHKHTHIYI